MRKTIGTAFALFGALVAAVSIAQVAPSTLPPNSLWGRLGISAGPGQAIPFANVQSAIGTFVSVATYGAVAADTTQSTVNQTAFQNALATGKAVYCPDGQTYYTRSITIPATAHSLFGKCTLTASGSYSGANAVLSATSNTGLVIRDVTIDMDFATFPAIDGIDIITSTNVVIDGVTAKGYNAIWDLTGTKTKIVNSTITDFKNIGIFSFGSTGFSAIGNIVTAAQSGSFYCIAAGTAFDVTFIGNAVTGCQSFGLIVYGSDTTPYPQSKRVVISGNRTKNTVLEGVNLTNVNNYAITGNQITWTDSSSTDFGISVFGNPNYGANGVAEIGTISGNEVSNSCKAGITQANNAHRAAITGNTIYNANNCVGATAYHIEGILLYGGAAYNVVSGNNILDPNARLTWGVNEFNDGIAAPNFNTIGHNTGVGSSGAVNVIGASSAIGNPCFYALAAGTCSGLSGKLSLAAGKTATISNTLTFTGTDTSSVAFGTGGTVLYTSRIVIPFGSQSGVGGAGVTNFFLIGASATELNIYGVSPVTGTFKNLYLNLNTAPGGIQTDVFTLRVNGSDTAVTCTVTGAAVSCNDTTHTAAVTAGQTFSLKIVGSASAAATIVNGGIELDTQ